MHRESEKPPSTPPAEGPPSPERRAARLKEIKERYPGIPEAAAERLAELEARTAEEKARADAAEVDPISGLPGRLAWERDKAAHVAAGGAVVSFKAWIFLPPGLVDFVKSQPPGSKFRIYWPEDEQ